MNRFQIAKIIATGATIANVLGFMIVRSYEGNHFIVTIGMLMLTLGIMATIVAYCFAGFGKALSISSKIAKWGWIILPFPADIVTFIAMIIVAMLIFFVLPIIPVLMACKENGY